MCAIATAATIFLPYFAVGLGRGQAKHVRLYAKQPAFCFEVFSIENSFVLYAEPLQPLTKGNWDGQRQRRSAAAFLWECANIALPAKASESV